MKFSQLQRYILKQTYLNRGKLVKSKMISFYDKRKKKPKHDDMINIITKSVDRLIHKELMVGQGVKTAKRWFVREVRLTPKGKKWAKSIFGKQLALTLVVKKNKKNKNKK